ncbi:hypothetical protein JCM11641_002464 [Rhodosporidiobolus odoratus]
MPAPRAARMAIRKSVVPDPDLYGDPSDSDDDNSPNRPPPPPPPKPSNKSRSKGPPPVRGSVTAENGRRRSTRLSNESVESVGAAPPLKPSKGSSRAPKAAIIAEEPPSPARTKQTSRGKKRAARERVSSDEEEQQEQEEEAVKVAPAGKAAKVRAGAKRARVDREDEEEQDYRVPAGPVASGSQQSAPAPRRGFVPRAAASQSTRLNKPPPEYSTLLVDESADDPEPFPFTTNPPTPHATGQTKRAAAKPKAKPRAKAPRTARQAPTTSDEITPDDSRPPPIPSTSRSRFTPPRPPLSDREPVHVHETPVQVKNIAFRQGPGTPATAGRSARRSSARGSRNRGSSIGGGFEAAPHPQVADDKLYRSTDADDPLAKRLRSIVSWSAQRTRNRVHPSTPGAEMDEAERVAKDVLDGFIADVCSLRVDTSVPFSEPSQSQDPDQLPPHPQNESNAAKMKELEENYAAIAHEQELRQSLEPVYQTFFDRRTEAHAAASTSYATLLPPTLTTDGLAKYAASLELSRPNPTSLEEALELGRSLLAGEGVKDKQQGGKKGKGKARADDPAEGSEDGLDRRILDAQIETASLRHLTHRLTSFTRVADAYITHRTSETHRSLTLRSQQGLLDAPSSASSSSAPTGAAREAADQQSGDGAGLASAVGNIGSGSGDVARGGSLDMRDLLRAISRAEMR